MCYFFNVTYNQRSMADFLVCNYLRVWWGGREKACTVMYLDVASLRHLLPYLHSTTYIRVCAKGAF